MKIHLVLVGQKRFSNGNPDTTLVWYFKIEKIKIIVIEYISRLCHALWLTPEPSCAK